MGARQPDDPLKVLFLEDDPGVAMWAKQAFIFLAGIDDIEVVTDNFEQLYNVARWEDVDAFVTDWMVPGFSVRDLLVWVRKHLPEVRNIVFTAMEPDTVDHGGNADRVIKKGTPFADLVEAIRA